MKDWSPTSARSTIPVGMRLDDASQGDPPTEPQEDLSDDETYSSLSLTVPGWLSRGKAAPLPVPQDNEGGPLTLVLQSKMFDAISCELQDQYRIGRAVENELAWTWDVKLSRRHCRLIRLGKSVWIEDLGSSNGTWVDGVPTVRRQLRGGEQITVGSLEFQVFFLRGK